ncbi:uncharacterized protein LTR77_003447 [Saxophila tyrrhenica]|uniref:Uncharacterized protein n=1 Tax=Saxophila tyrrhenica TaxID=1690608 RepID=A0AAV9PH42_9PEZI|nr:hypothetical protein LTR77_003447 [Saxophila tyrrhenica]
MSPRYPSLDIASAWISLILPLPGHETSFNRWYSDDHFYAGGMCLPGIFAGRRWIAPQALRSLNYASDPAMAEGGSFLHLNLFSSHQSDEAYRALGQTLQVLGEEGRMYGDSIERRHLYSAITPYEGVVYRDGEGFGEGPMDIHALDYPFQGVVVEIVEAKSGEGRVELVRWLKGEFVPRRLEGSDVVMCLVFRHEDLPEGVRSPRLPGKCPTGDKRVVLLWFVEGDPKVCLERDFGGHVEEVKEKALGEVVFLGPFVPTVPGTNSVSDVEQLFAFPENCVRSKANDAASDLRIKVST